MQPHLILRVVALDDDPEVSQSLTFGPHDVPWLANCNFASFLEWRDEHQSRVIRSAD
jgi:hypothetical protein